MLGYHLLERLWYNRSMQELWRDVAGYENLYQISDYGRLRRLPKAGRRRNSINISYPRGSLNTKGYLKYKLYSLDGTKKTYSAHQLVARAFINNPLVLPQVNHKDGNKLNNNMLNLEWCTNLENAKHAHVTGLADTRGEKSGMNKYPESLIRLALETKGKITSAEFAKTHGISYLYVKAIRSGHRWNHLWKEYYGTKTA